MNSRLKAIIIGAAVTLLLWGIAFVVLNAIYHGNFPWLPTVLAAFLGSLVGGLIASRLEQQGSGARLGALSGCGAGLVVLLAVAVASRLAPLLTLLGVGVVVISAIAGGLGGVLMRAWLPREA